MSKIPANRPPIASSNFRRALFHNGADSVAQRAHARTILRMLLVQDGSTTRLCEALAGSEVSVRVFEQDVVSALPGPLQDALPGSKFIRRLSSLVANGAVLLDSLSFIALEGLQADVRRELEQADVPIGHLLGRLWTRRDFRRNDGLLFDELWQKTGMPDPAASRSYTIVSPDGPRMVIGETFRRGLLTSPRTVRDDGGSQRSGNPGR